MDNWIDELLAKEAERAPLGDEGFSARVLQRIPSRLAVFFRRVFVYSAALVVGAVACHFSSGDFDAPGRLASWSEQAGELLVEIPARLSGMSQLSLVLLAAAAALVVATMIQSNE